MRSSFATAATLFAAAVLIAGCEVPEAATEVTAEEHRERAAQAWSDFEAALAAGDAEGSVAIYTEDVVVRGVGPEFERVRGPAAYRDLLAGLFETFAIEHLDVEVEDVIVLDRHVFEAGTFSETIRVRETDQTVPIRGSYAALWRQEADGEWRIHRFIWNEQPQGEM